jgi:hypothetical protein
LSPSTNRAGWLRRRLADASRRRRPAVRQTNERSIAARTCMTVCVYLPSQAMKSQALRTAIATAAARHMIKALDTLLFDNAHLAPVRLADSQIRAQRLF